MHAHNNDLIPPVFVVLQLTPHHKKPAQTETLFDPTPHNIN